ncbi:MAG: hypothetical protein WC374_13010 [Phycisphaerae bacterium]|jgi:hypothetical protein
MAKYDVKFSCGHTEVKELFGPTKDRYSKIEYWEKYGICTECYREQKKAEAKIEAEKNGLQEKEVSYKEYKQNYADCKTVPGSYNGETKTIKIYCK